MKTRFCVALVAAVGVAALAACTATPEEDDDTEEVEGTDDELKALELSCKAGGTKFDLKANEGTLDTGAFKTSFSCATPKGDAGKAAAVLACTERKQKVHAGKWTATVTQSGGTYKTTIKRGNGLDLTLPCSAVAQADAGPAKADAGVNGGGNAGGAAPTYAEVAPLIASTCGPCHDDTFGTIDALKKRKKQMLDALSQGRMPKNKPAWHLSDDGKKLIDFLQNSKELL